MSLAKVVMMEERTTLVLGFVVGAGLRSVIALHSYWLSGVGIEWLVLTGAKGGMRMRVAVMTIATSNATTLT